MNITYTARQVATRLAGHPGNERLVEVFVRAQYPPITETENAASLAVMRAQFGELFEEGS